MVSDFRYEFLPKVSRRERNYLRRLRSSLGRQPSAKLSSWASRSVAAERIEFRLGRTGTLFDNDNRLLRTAASVELSGPGGAAAFVFIDAKLSRWLAAQQLALKPELLDVQCAPAVGGVVAHAVASALAAMGAGSLWNVVGEVESQRVGDLWFVELNVHLPRVSGCIWIAVAEESWSRLDNGRPGVCLEQVHRLSELSVELPLVLGKLSSTRGEALGLGAGDIIVSSTIPHAPARELRLEVGQQGFFAVEVEDCRRRLKIRSAYCRGVSTMAAEAQDKEQSRLAEDLPVEIVLELARHRLSGVEVLSLGAGDVLTLDRPLAGGIDLRVGGKLIARGELVDVEGEAGVRLVEMLD